MNSVQMLTTLARTLMTRPPTRALATSTTRPTLGRIPQPFAGTRILPALSQICYANCCKTPLMQSSRFLSSMSSSPIVVNNANFGQQRQCFGQSVFKTNATLLQLTSNVVNQLQPRRSVVRFSFLNGKRKTVKAVIRRFYRLHWGIWIRPKAGRHKKLWKKNSARRKRARQHVFCNATQSNMLDKMVSRYWRKKKYYVDDPYESYHKRDSYWITNKL